MWNAGLEMEAPAGPGLSSQAREQLGALAGRGITGYEGIRVSCACLKARIADGALFSALSSRLKPDIVNGLPVQAVVMTLHALASANLRSPLTEALLSRVAAGRQPQQLLEGSQEPQLFPDLAPENAGAASASSSLGDGASLPNRDQAASLVINNGVTSNLTSWSAEDNNNPEAPCASSLPSTDSPAQKSTTDLVSSSSRSSCVPPVSTSVSSSSPCSPSLRPGSGNRTSSLLSFSSSASPPLCVNRSAQPGLSSSSPAVSPGVRCEDRTQRKCGGHGESSAVNQHTGPAFPVGYAGSIMMSLLKLGASDRVDTIRAVCGRCRTPETAPVCYAAISAGQVPCIHSSCFRPRHQGPPRAVGWC